MIRIQTVKRVNLGRAKAGEGFTFNGHPYQYKGATEYTNDAGARRVLAWIGAPCAICGEGFTIQTNRNPKWLPKTCPRHRGQAIPADGGVVKHLMAHAAAHRGPGCP